MRNPEHTAVVLLQFGGPDSLNAVEPFLFNLFSDPDIIQLPFSSLLQKRFAKIISTRRAPKVSDKYKEIGGLSPIVPITESQRQALQHRLDIRFGTGIIPVVTAMRYWKPFTADVISDLKSRDIRNVILLPLYPQYSKTNAGSSFNEWDRQKTSQKYSVIERRIIHYHLHPKYLEAVCERIRESLSQSNDPRNQYLLFSAHGIPIEFVFQGDLYPIHITQTMNAVVQRLGISNKYSLAYQSKVGPTQWLLPSTESELQRLPKQGIHSILVIPIAFVSDHIETAHELDIELREIAEHNGVTEFHVMEGLNTSPLFIDALEELVLSELTEFISE
jgi:ferrochelatase